MSLRFGPLLIIDCSEFATVVDPLMSFTTADAFKLLADINVLKPFVDDFPRNG